MANPDDHVDVGLRNLGREEICVMADNGNLGKVMSVWSYDSGQEMASLVAFSKRKTTDVGTESALWSRGAVSVRLGGGGRDTRKDRTGKELGRVGDPTVMTNPVISPGGRRIPGYSGSPEEAFTTDPKRQGPVKLAIFSDTCGTPLHTK